MKTLMILALAGSLFTGASAIDTLIDPIPTRLFGNQCKDVCRDCSAVCSVDGVPQSISCNVGTSRTDCCSYCGLD